MISVPRALVLAAIMLGAAVALGASISVSLLGVLGFYIALNTAYSMFLKHLSLVDAMVVATGFILRIYAGTIAAGVLPSAWILLCTLFLALFLAFGKRRAELNVANSRRTSSHDVMKKYEVTEGEITSTRTAVQEFEEAPRDVTATRTVLHKYNVVMLDRFCNICATLAIATYSLFTVQGVANHALIITTPPVVMGIFRYILLVERYQEGEAPEAVLFKDWAIQLAVVIWLILYMAVLYGGLHIDVL